MTSAMIGRAVQLSVMMLATAAFITTNSTIIKVKNDDDDLARAICSKKCSQIFKNIERPTHEWCVLKCRNYIEETIFRPRSLENTMDIIDGARSSRAAAPRNHMFVRVGKSLDSQADSDEDSMNSSAAAAAADPENDGEMAKRRTGGFVRIGRRANEEFADDIDQKRANKPKGQAFVRIGRKTANFVRIGKAFVRKGETDNELEEEDVDNDNDADAL